MSAEMSEQGKRRLLDAIMENGRREVKLTHNLDKVVLGAVVEQEFDGYQWGGPVDMQMVGELVIMLARGQGRLQFGHSNYKAAVSVAGYIVRLVWDGLWVQPEDEEEFLAALLDWVDMVMFRVAGVMWTRRNMELARVAEEEVGRRNAKAN